MSWKDPQRIDRLAAAYLDRGSIDFVDHRPEGPASPRAYRVRATRVGEELVLFRTDVSEATSLRRRLDAADAARRAAEQAADIGLVGIEADPLTLDAAAQALLGISSRQVAASELLGRVPPSEAEALELALRGGPSATFRVQSRQGRWLELLPAGSSEIAVLRDVTELVNARDAVGHSRRMLADLVENLPKGVLLLDRSGRIVTVNAAAEQTIGRSRDELEGLVAAEELGNQADVHGQPIPPELCPAAQVIRHQRRVDRYMGRFEVEGRGLRWLEISGRPLDGPDLGGLLVFEDVTEQRIAAEHRRQLESLARDAQEMESLQVLAAGVAHDFGNLLTAVSTAAEYLGQTVMDDAARECVEDIGLATDRGRALIGDMTQLARPMRASIGTVAPKPVLEEVARIARRELPPGAQLVVEVEPGVPGASAGERELVNALVNLTFNAIHALAEREGNGSGLVRLSARRGGAEDEAHIGRHPVLLLEVEDDGMGIDGASLEKIFRPFFTTKGRRGTGLGLVMVKRTALAFGGDVRIDSEVGKGTKVSLLLPGVIGPPTAG